MAQVMALGPSDSCAIFGKRICDSNAREIGAGGGVERRAATNVAARGRNYMALIRRGVLW